MSLIQIGLILLLLAASVYTDMRDRRIPNKITVPFALSGLIINTINHGLSGTKESVFGFLLGFFVFLIPYAMRAMGAGDVKLMAALGALSNWRFILYTTLFTALAGGLLVIAMKGLNRELGSLLKNVGKLFLYGPLLLLSKVMNSPKLYDLSQKYYPEISRESSNYVPYAVAIALGGISSLILVWIGRITIG